MGWKSLESIRKWQAKWNSNSKHSHRSYVPSNMHAWPHSQARVATHLLLDTSGTLHTWGRPPLHASGKLEGILITSEPTCSLAVFRCYKWERHSSMHAGPGLCVLKAQLLGNWGITWFIKVPHHVGILLRIFPSRMGKNVPSRLHCWLLGP